MAFRTASYWKGMASQIGGNRCLATATATAPKMKPYVETLENVADARRHTQWNVMGQFLPVYVAIGMIVLSTTLGLATAKQQLLYAPNVFVSKKRREMLPEVYDPDYVVEEADKYIQKSLFRRVGYVQEADVSPAINAPTRANAVTCERKAETLKSVGVDPNK